MNPALGEFPAWMRQGMPQGVPTQPGLATQVFPKTAVKIGSGDIATPFRAGVRSMQLGKVPIKPLAPLAKGVLGKAGVVGTIASAIDAASTATRDRMVETGAAMPSFIASSNKPTQSWGAPTSALSISNTNPFTGAPVKKTFTPLSNITPDGAIKQPEPPPVQAPITDSNNVFPPASYPALDLYHDVNRDTETKKPNAGDNALPPIAMGDDIQAPEWDVPKYVNRNISLKEGLADLPSSSSFLGALANLGIGLGRVKGSRSDTEQENKFNIEATNQGNMGKKAALEASAANQKNKYDYAKLMQEAPLQAAQVEHYKNTAKDSIQQERLRGLQADATAAALKYDPTGRTALGHQSATPKSMKLDPAELSTMGLPELHMLFQQAAGMNDAPAAQALSDYIKTKTKNK